jgi:hypothetical protein
MLLTSSVKLSCLHSPLCSIPVDMRHLSGPNFIIKILTFPPPIISWVQARLSLIFTFKMGCYSIWAISVFLQASVKILFGNPTIVRWHNILAWRKLWSFSRKIFIGQNFDRMSASMFSKMAILIACKKKITTIDIAKLFFERVWIHFWIPQTIIFDRENRFLSTFWSSLLSLLDTKLTKSTSFHP